MDKFEDLVPEERAAVGVWPRSASPLSRRTKSIRWPAEWSGMTSIRPAVRGSLFGRRRLGYVNWPDRCISTVGNLCRSHCQRRETPRSSSSSSTRFENGHQSQTASVNLIVPRGLLVAADEAI